MSQYPPGQPQQPMPPPGQYPQYRPVPQGYPPYPQPLPGYQYPPPHPPSVPQKWYRTNAGIIVLLIFFFPAGLYLMWKYARWPKNAKWIVTGILAFCVLMGGIANAASPTQQMSQIQQPIVGSTTVPMPTSTLVPTSTPTPQSIHYPPTTVADLHGLAAKGDASAIHEFHSESVGAVGVCPQPKREVTVDPSVTGQHLAEDLLAYFYVQQLDNPCGSLVLAYHTQSEANDAYTAGRINFDVTDSSGASNMDPNATDLKHTLTLDTGDVATSQESSVTY